MILKNSELRGDGKMEKGYPQKLWVKLSNKDFDDETIEAIEKYLENNAPSIYKYYYIGDGLLKRKNITIGYDGDSWVLRNDQGVELRTDNKLELIQTISKRFEISMMDAVAVEQLCLWLKEAYENRGKPIVEKDTHQLFKVESLKAVVENAKPTEWLIHQLLPKRGLIFLAGKAGVGKSFLALAMAHAISSNSGKVFECLDVEDHGKVLIIDGENYPSTYKDRIETMQLKAIDNIDIVILQNFYLDRIEYLRELEEYIKTNGYKLIIFDPWTCLIGNIDENKAADVSKILNELRRIAYENNTCFLIIHHLRKNLAYAVKPLDELRGSSGLVNEADLVAILSMDKFGRVLRVVKSRLDHPITLKIKFDDSGGKLKITAEKLEVVEEDLDELGKTMDEIINLMMFEGGSIQRKQLVKELVENRLRSERTLDRALKVLMKTGKIQRIKKGHYKLNL